MEVAAVATPNILDLILMNLGSSKIFNGLIMIIMNIGGKYLPMEIPQYLDKKFTQHQMLRYIVLFAVCFMATRDIKISLLLWLILIGLFRFVFNDSSVYSIVPKKDEKESENKYESKKVSIQEVENAQKVINQYFKENNFYYRSHPSLQSSLI